VPRPERPVDPSQGPIERFAHSLRKLREESGNPPYRDMADRAHFSKATLSAAASGHRLPTWDVAAAYVRACDGDVDEWRTLWLSTRTELGLGPADDVDPGTYMEDARDQAMDQAAVAGLVGGRWQRKRILAVIAIAVVVSAVVGSLILARTSGRTNRQSLTPGVTSSVESPARFVGGQEPVVDNADPKKSGCAADPAGITTLDRVQVNTANENFLGEAQLRHSPGCHASWGRFEPGARLTYLQSTGPVHITITAHRPATGTVGTPYTTAFDGQAAFGNILLDAKGCVEVTIQVDAPDGVGSATTNCLR
jgi:hypothetical protein